MSASDQSRKRPTTSRAPPMRALSEREKVLELIRSRGNTGVWLADIKKETMIAPNRIQKEIKILVHTKLIKEVKDIRHKARKVYMAIEFEPSEEMAGGAWHSDDGSLNTGKIDDAKSKCKELIRNLKAAATADVLFKEMNRSSDNDIIYNMQQIMQVLEVLVLDKEVEEVRSTGKGDFVNVPVGKVCYRVAQKSGGAHFGSLASIPCGICPRFRDCTPDGVISPRNCEYYKKWLGLDFF